MNDFERTDRFRRNLEYSTRLTTSSWAIHVLHDLKAVPKSSDPNSNVAVGFGLQYKVMNLRQGFHQLESKNVLRAYRTARQRLILLDWGGTLVTDSLKSDSLLSYAIATGQVSREGPSSQLKTTMELLCSDVKNMVFVVSGKEVHAVQEYFGSFKGLGLGAEHGSYYRWPRDDLHMNDDNHTLIGQGKWRTAVEIIDQSWKESAKLLMDIFVQRTQGAYIEQKGNALIWQYRDADPEFGYMQSKELEEHLNEMLSSYPVTVIRGGGGGSDGYIEVRPSGVSKGNFLSHVHTLLKTFNKTPDFVLAIGDDLSDEPMFEQLNLLHETHKQMTPFSVTVGKKPSAAASYVDDPIAVMELLTTLSKVADREKKYFSTLDLPSHGQVKLPAHQLHFKAPPTVNESGQRFGRAISTGKLAFDNNVSSASLRRHKRLVQLYTFEKSLFNMMLVSFLAGES